MSVRTSIATALAKKLGEISVDTGFKTTLYGNAYPKLKFWDECHEFPSIYMSIGGERREYLPGNFKWGFLNIAIKVYVKGEEPAELLELVLEDIEKVIDTNRTLVYAENTPGAQTTEILIDSIITDEGLLAPYGVGEVTITIQYPVLN